MAEDAKATLERLIADARSAVWDAESAAHTLEDAAAALQEIADGLGEGKDAAVGPAPRACAVMDCDRKGVGSGSLEFPSPATGIPVVLSLDFCEAHLVNRPTGQFYVPSRARWEAA